jgi:hypothetical protein
VASSWNAPSAVPARKTRNPLLNDIREPRPHHFDAVDLQFES